MKHTINPSPSWQNTAQRMGQQEAAMSSDEQQAPTILPPMQAFGLAVARMRPSGAEITIGTEGVLVTLAAHNTELFLNPAYLSLGSLHCSTNRLMQIGLLLQGIATGHYTPETDGERSL